MIVERNYYKENYYELREKLHDLEIVRRTQPSPPEANMRKRELASALFGKIIDSVHNFATDMKETIGEFARPVEPEPQSRASAALWNM